MTPALVARCLEIQKGNWYFVLSWPVSRYGSMSVWTKTLSTQTLPG